MFKLPGLHRGLNSIFSSHHDTALESQQNLHETTTELSPFVFTSKEVLVSRLRVFEHV